MKCLAFDLGKVLFDFDYGIALDKIKDKVDVLPDDIVNALFYKDFGTDFEKGLIDGRGFYKKFVEEFGARITYDEFVELWCGIFWPIEEMIELVRKLRTAYPVYLISNINELHFNYLKVRYPDVFSLFKGLVLSFKVKAVKPQIEIYNELKNMSHFSYRDIIYIDDREDLIDKAKSFGINSIRFSNISQLISSLKSYSVSIPGDGHG